MDFSFSDPPKRIYMVDVFDSLDIDEAVRVAQILEKSDDYERVPISVYRHGVSLALDGGITESFEEESSFYSDAPADVIGRYRDNYYPTHKLWPTQAEIAAQVNSTTARLDSLNKSIDSDSPDVDPDWE